VKDEKAAELLSTLIPTILDALPDAMSIEALMPTVDNPRSGDQDKQPESTAFRLIEGGRTESRKPPFPLPRWLLAAMDCGHGLR
jgi:hypothetical protein